MKKLKTSLDKPSPSFKHKLGIIFIGGGLHLLKFLGEGIMYLRSGRKPILVMKMPRTASQSDYITAVTSVMQDKKINRDYHVFILKGNTNADFTHEVFYGKFKRIEIEELRRTILADILERKANEDRQKMDFAKLKHGNKHYSEGGIIKKLYPGGDPTTPGRN